MPPPLCWRTLSDADLAPPPFTYEVPDFCLNVAASSQTSVHQTLLRVHVPRQCTPSPLFGPMMALERVAPSWRRKTASASPPSACSEQVLAVKSAGQKWPANRCTTNYTYCYGPIASFHHRMRPWLRSSLLPTASSWPKAWGRLFAKPCWSLREADEDASPLRLQGLQE